MISTTTLDNGLEVVTEEMPGATSVAAGFWVGTGGRDEPDSRSGASHFLEHLLFKGTPERSAQEIARSIDAVGGDMNAFTAKEYTAFHVRLLGEDLDLGLEILSDIIWSPSLSEEDVDAERQVILEEIAMHADEAADFVHELASSALFPGHSLGREVLGSTETVESMTAQDVREFFSLHYRPANMVFAAAGALEHASVVEGLAKRFRGSSGGLRPKRLPPELPPLRQSVADRPGEQVHLVVAMRAPDRHDERRWALDVLDHALGGGLSSRLFQEVREKRGLAYSVYSDRVAYDDAGAFSVYAGTQPQRLAEVASVLSEELSSMARHALTPRELEIAKGHLRASLLMALEDPGARMSRIGRSSLLHGEILPVEEVLSRVEGVRLEDVADLAAEVLSGPRIVALCGPIEGMSDRVEVLL